MKNMFQHAEMSSAKKRIEENRFLSYLFKNILPRNPYRVAIDTSRYGKNDGLFVVPVIREPKIITCFDDGIILLLQKGVKKCSYYFFFSSSCLICF